jgi:6-phosphogluconolactonase
MGEVGMENNHFKLIDFKTREALVESLKQDIVDALSDAIAQKGFATLVLSGGSTPVELLKRLSVVEFAWEKVRVTLVDERWVDTSSEKSNEKLVRTHFLVNNAKNARFFHLKTDGKYAKDSLTTVGVTLEKLSHELDVVVLGMGLDGHTASFFPHSKELEHALSTDDLVCATTATLEPKERITLSRSYLISATHLFLHIEGKEKKEVFTRASKSDDVSSMPIIAMMQQTQPLLEVYYAD